MQTTTTKFQVREVSPGCLLLTCQGTLSWEDRELLGASIEPFLQQSAVLKGVVLDLAGVTHANSAGLGALFQLVQRLHGRAARLAFAQVPPMLVRLFRAVGLDRLACLCPDVETAVRTLQANEPADRGPAPTELAGPT